MRDFYPFLYLYAAKLNKIFEKNAFNGIKIVLSSKNNKKDALLRCCEKCI